MIDPSYHYVIYDRPKDHPEHFIVRRWNVTTNPPVPDEEHKTALTLEEARTHIPHGYVCLPRWAGDDPVIAETWI